MKLNWAERLAVNNPFRVLEQRIEIGMFKRMIPLKPGSVVLEIGCGRGAGAGLIIEKFEPSRVHAMDLDVDMIERAKTYLPRAKLERISLFAGDVYRLPLKGVSVDAVFGFGVLHHVPDWRTALGEIARVLRPGGVYFMEELYPTLYQNFITRHILLHPTEDRFSGEDFRQALYQAALSLKHVREFKGLGFLGVAVKEEDRCTIMQPVPGREGGT
jgi:ubiquinone/menaquinone biosynthesis C-methylase UbiE